MTTPDRTYYIGITPLPLPAADIQTVLRHPVQDGTEPPRLREILAPMFPERQTIIPANEEGVLIPPGSTPDTALGTVFASDGPEDVTVVIDYTNATAAHTKLEARKQLLQQKCLGNSALNHALTARPGSSVIPLLPGEQYLLVKKPDAERRAWGAPEQHPEIVGVIRYSDMRSQAELPDPKSPSPSVGFDDSPRYETLNEILDTDGGTISYPEI